MYLSKKVNPRNKVLIPCQLNKPNPKCYVCSEKREVSVKVHLDKMTVKIFEEKILKGDLVTTTLFIKAWAFCKIKILIVTLRVFFITSGPTINYLLQIWPKIYPLPLLVMLKWPLNMDIEVSVVNKVLTSIPKQCGSEYRTSLVFKWSKVVR